MDQVREVLRYHHYAYRTEQSYCQWILRYIHHFGGKTHPRLLGARDVESFLSHLASVGKVAASTQRQALNALVFLYREVLDISLEGKIAPIKIAYSSDPGHPFRWEAIKIKRPPKLPTVLTRPEVKNLFAAMEGKHALMARLMYGSGLRLLECIRLRVKDLDFGQKMIFVRGGKGGKDRSTVLPKNLTRELRSQVKADNHTPSPGSGGRVRRSVYPRGPGQKIFQRGSGNRLAMGVPRQEQIS